MLVTNKKMREFAGYLGEAMTIQQESIEAHNEALTHIGSALKDLNTLVQLQNTRIESLESRQSGSYVELIGKTFKGSND